LQILLGVTGRKKRQENMRMLRDFVRLRRLMKLRLKDGV